MRLEAVMRIDLPSSMICERAGALARFFGASKKATGETRVLADTFTLVDQFIEGFRSMGITNAIALKIDDKMIYRDTREREDDVDRMIAALDRNRELIDDKFHLLQLAMECRREGIRYIFDTQVRAHVKLDKDEVQIAVSGKIEELGQHDGESPGDHRERVRRLVNDKHFKESYDLQFKLFLDDVLQKLRIHTNAMSGRIDHTAQSAKETGTARPRQSHGSRLTPTRKNARRDSRRSRLTRTVVRAAVTGGVSGSTVRRIVVKKGSAKGYSKTITAKKISGGFDGFFRVDLAPLELLDDLVIELGQGPFDIDDTFPPRGK
jgi:hypothetical protein